MPSQPHDLAQIADEALHVSIADLMTGSRVLSVAAGELFPGRPGDRRDIDSVVGPDAAAFGGHVASITPFSSVVHTRWESSSPVRVAPRLAAVAHSGDR
jgi:hypothetical protein